MSDNKTIMKRLSDPVNTNTFSIGLNMNKLVDKSRKNKHTANNIKVENTLYP